MTPLKEDALDQCREDANSICRFLDKNTHIWYDLIDYDSYPMNTSVVTFKVEGDWRHDHMAFKQAIHDWADQMDKEIFKIDEQEIGSSDSDDYTAQYSVFIASDKESMRILNSMRGLFAEGLNQKEKQIYVKAVNEAEDIEDLEDICHEIYFYDKKLFAHINKFPKNASFKDIKANILKNLQGSLGESFSSNEINKLESDIKNMNIGDSITVKNYKNGDTYKFVKRNDGNQISAFENVLGKNHMASPQQVFGWAKDSLIYSDFKPKFSKNESLKEATMPYTKWVKRAKDGEWVMWGGSYSDELDPDFLYEINHPNFPNNSYNIENQYIDAMILPAGKEPVDESLNESSSLNYIVEPHRIDMDLYDIVFCKDDPHAGKRAHSKRFDSYDDALKFIKRNARYNNWYAVPMNEDTIKTKGGKWTNKGDEGTHGKFRTKKEADAQRKAMFANGFKEELNASDYDLAKSHPSTVKVFNNCSWNDSCQDPEGKNPDHTNVIRYNPTSDKYEFISFSRFDDHIWVPSYRLVSDTLSGLYNKIDESIYNENNSTYVYLVSSNKVYESLKEGSTKLDIIKSNKSLYNRITLAASKMPDGLKKSILLYYALPWCKNNNWLGGMPDSATNKVIYRLMDKGYDQDEIMDEIDKFIDCFVDTYSSFSGENNKLSKYLQESLKESYYKLCWYDSDPETGFYGDKFDCYAVVKAFDAKDAQEKFKDLLLRTGDEQDRDRIRYFKNFTDYLQDSEMYIDDATEDEYNEYKDYQDARFESLNKNEALEESVSQDLIDAIIWNYGCSKTEAKKLANDMSQERKDLLVKGWKDQAKKSFYESFGEYDLINYNDFLANNFDGWSDDIDYLIKDLNKIAKALGTVARKLVFYVDYDEEFWAADEIADVTLYLNEDYSIYESKDLHIKFAAMIPDNVWIFKNENEANQIINNVKAFNSESEEDDLQEALRKNKKFKKDFFKTVNEALTRF